jgi:hypothetical protein
MCFCNEQEDCINLHRICEKLNHKIVPFISFIQSVAHSIMAADLPDMLRPVASNQLFYVYEICTAVHICA